MADPPSLDYPALLQRALRGMVKEVLERVAREGLPGEHHFYLTFRTGARGVALPDSLRRQHPDEMTIVLQHQYSGLEVESDAFSVTLRFSGAPARLTVPFEALTAFLDPSVSFGLRLAEQPAPEPAPATAEPASGPPGNVVAFKRPGPA